MLSVFSLFCSWKDQSKEKLNSIKNLRCVYYTAVWNTSIYNVAISISQSGAGSYKYEKGNWMVTFIPKVGLLLWLTPKIM